MKRDTFHRRISNGLIGPGSDSFGNPDDEEIISDYPLQRYFSAILFPEKKYSASEEDEDEAIIQSETEEATILEPEVLSLGIGHIEPDEPKCEENISDYESKANQNRFNPNNFGVTFCVENDVVNVGVVFSGGFYYVPEKQSDIKIKISEVGYQSFMEDSLGFPFRDLLIYQDGFMSLSRELKGDKGGKNKRSGEYVIFDEFKKTDNFKDSSVKYYILKFRMSL